MAGDRRAKRTPGNPRAANHSVLGALLLAATTITLLPWNEPALHHLEPAAWNSEDVLPWLHLELFWPYAALPTRLHALERLLILFIVGLTASVAFQLFRGTGRNWAVLATGPVCAVALSDSGHPWVTRNFELLFAIPALLAIRTIVRPLVHVGQLTPSSAARSLAWASLTVFLRPSAGILLVMFLVLIVSFRQRTAHHILLVLRSVLKKNHTQPSSKPKVKISSDLSPASQSLSKKVASHMRQSVLLGLTPLWVAVAFYIFRSHLGFESTLVWPWSGKFSIGFVGASSLAPKLAFPGVALLVLLVAPLRWRGGFTMVGLLLLTTTFFQNDQPLFPLAFSRPLIVVAASGWIWLAGSILPKHGYFSSGFAAGASLLVLYLGSTPPQSFSSSASNSSASADSSLWKRSSPLNLSSQGQSAALKSYLDELHRPGDVLGLHDRELFDDAVNLQALEGYRPDLTLFFAPDVDRRSLALATANWISEEKRIFSDSFEMGGKWDASWTESSGPLYRFRFGIHPASIKDPSKVESNPYSPTELRGFEHWFRTGFNNGGPRPLRDSRQLQRWVRAEIERSRFLRTREKLDEAIRRLPLEAKQLHTASLALRDARTNRLPAQGESELRFGSNDILFHTELPPQAWARAELGDLLYSAGEHHLGTKILNQASTEHGLQAAELALIRWQLKSGREDSAFQNVRSLAQKTSLGGIEDKQRRSQVEELLSWLARSGNVKPALELRERIDQSHFPSAPDLATVEARLSLLQRIAANQ